MVTKRSLVFKISNIFMKRYDWFLKFLNMVIKQYEWVLKSMSKRP